MSSNLILVASATAATASSAIEALSAAGVRVRAFVRKLDDPRAAKFAALPGVELFAGDLSNAADVAAALTGASRSLLVSGAFSFDQFETESLFIEAAARAGLEVTVRVSTASGLIKPGTKGAYGRTHHGIAAFIEASKYKVVDLNPDWYLSNWFGNAGEAKAAGRISWPVAGNSGRFGVIDPRDVGKAAAAILLQPATGLEPFLARRAIEVHGSSVANFEEIAAAISASVGYDIKVQQVPRDAWVAVLQGFGIPRVFATSFLETVEQAAGITPPGYEAYGPPVMTGETSPELLGIGWKAITLAEWAASAEVKAVFAK